MMLGLTDISGGEVRVLGFNPAREPLSVKRRVGYLPDTVGFYDNLTAADNLRYTARLIGFRLANARNVSPTHSIALGLPKLPTSVSTPSHAACGSAWASPKS